MIYGGIQLLRSQGVCITAIGNIMGRGWKKVSTCENVSTSRNAQEEYKNKNLSW